jgi:hypothetical protein
MLSSEAARELAAAVLATALPRRWRHVQAVAHVAEQIAIIPTVHRDTLVVAAWLHDIGYGPDLVRTGFHPLDGARYLRRLRTVPARTVCLVAHHSCAAVEADERGLRNTLVSEFAREISPTSDALWFADMTTGPDGELLDVRDRLAEVRKRYGPTHVVTRFVDRAEDEIAAAVKRTQDRLAAARADGPARLGLDSGDATQ